jgi:large subunit ribosomal protein L4
MGCLDSVLIITEDFNENLMLAARNLVNVLVVEPRYADPVSLVFYKKVLITKAALTKIEEMLA